MKNKLTKLHFANAVLFATLLPGAVLAQAPAATPSPAKPPTPPLLEAPAVKGPPFELDPAFKPKPADPVPGLPAPTEPAPAAAPAAAPAPASPNRPLSTTSPVPKGSIMLNFQGASLNDVLNYLSEAAGFVIVKEADVSGTVNVVSRQPITADDAVDLLNTVLIEKGYVAIRNNRILKIVKREGAQKRDLPVLTGSDPDRIPRRDEMVTQILPLRFGEAAKLIENLRPLLPDNATISANESSNSILMTDTQANIRRIAEIIRAIDTSVASISTIRIYPLQYANAKELATVITQLFAQSGTSTGGGGGRRGGGFPGFGGFGGPGGGGGQQPSAQSEARQANSRVIAVADDQSNSLIVSAPEELIPNITEVISKIDTSITDVTDTRIFRLINADATETAEIITSLYADTSSQTSQQNRNNQGGRGGFGGFGGFGGQGGQQSTTQTSGRALLQAKVVAVGDPRTNSLLVTAAADTMAQIAEMVGRLDSSSSKKQKVYFHALQHADADSVANVLRGMLGDQSAVSAASQTGLLDSRRTSGAALDTSEFSSSNAGRGGGGGGR